MKLFGFFATILTSIKPRGLLQLENAFVDGTSKHHQNRALLEMIGNENSYQNLEIWIPRTLLKTLDMFNIHILEERDNILKISFPVNIDWIVVAPTVIKPMMCAHYNLRIGKKPNELFLFVEITARKRGNILDGDFKIINEAHKYFQEFKETFGDK